MTALRILSLLAATLTMGLTAGAFALYAHTIMPGLAHTDDRTFVGSFQEMDRAIINPWFIGCCFFGALLLTAAAGLTARGTGAFVWVAIAFVLYLVSVVLTLAVNVPLNDALKASGDPRTIDVTAARAAFHETRWVVANVVRTLLTTGAFGLLAWALVVTER